MKKFITVKFLFSIYIYLFSIWGCAQVKTFNVKDFGASGNGKNDDYLALIKCIDTATKYPKSKIIIPFGYYKISKQLIVDYLTEDISIEGIPNDNDELPTIFSNSDISILWFRGYLFDASQGIARVNNLKLVSNNYPYNSTHSRINKPEWNAGLSITDKREAYIHNVTVENIYGEGIYIAGTQQENIPLTARFQTVEIKNSKILNVWGYNPRLDDYGDGIYISNVESAIIENNIIKNNFYITKQLGRAGIVIEYMAQNCNIVNNYIFGYDRGIHIEADYGGHEISKNIIEGTDLGITIYSPNIKNQNNPIRIIENTISNNNLPKKNNLKRVRGTSGISDRALLDFTAPNSSRTGSLVKNNFFNIDGTYDYFSNSIINIRADNIILLNNTYDIKNEEKLTYPINYFNFSYNIRIKGEDLSGIKEVILLNAGQKEKDAFKQNNNIRKSTIRK